MIAQWYEVKPRWWSWKWRGGCLVYRELFGPNDKTRKLAEVYQLSVDSGLDCKVWTHGLRVLNGDFDPEWDDGRFTMYGEEVWVKFRSKSDMLHFKLGFILES